MRRTTAALIALTVVALTAGSARAAQPSFFFERGYDAVASWVSETATERTTTSVVFLTVERGHGSSADTLTFLSYFSQTETWDGTAWQPVSAYLARAHTDNGDVITYAIGGGGSSITASAIAPALQCTPSFPNCAPAGSVELEASWVATGPNEGSPGHHVDDWTGSGCKLDFRSGSTISREAAPTVTIDDVEVMGEDLLFSQIEVFGGVEVLACP